MFDGIMEIPYAFEVFSPFCARVDHIEQAGLDPDADYPPTDYEELIEFATTLQEQGPGQYGFQIYGAADDITDLITQWTLAQGAEDGLYLNQDVTDTNIDNDVWKSQFSNFVDVFREHELSNPGTPNFLNEDGSTLLTQGEISMSAFDAQENPSMRNVAPDLIDDGTIRWAPTWSGPTKNRGLMLSFSYGVTRKPDDADADDWQNQQDAAIKYVEMMLSEEAQLKMWEDFGLVPVRKDVWDKLPDYAHKGLETQFTMAEDTNFARTAHPAAAAYIYGVMPGSFQKALSGEISPEEACDNAADAILEQYL
jgi:ABC-type glycerol-3-phosphate transport system substrate-binding protein